MTYKIWYLLLGLFMCHFSVTLVILEGTCHEIANEVLNLSFGIEPFDYGYLKRILEFRPFENTGVAPYHYFFALAFRNDPENSDLIFADIRVEQINRHKQYEFKVSKKYIANFLWFNSLTDRTQIEQMIDKKQPLINVTPSGLQDQAMSLC